MRLSEKTLELNFCSQFGHLLACDVLWFGLTQREEAQFGYDARIRIGGQVLIFQFKASSRTSGGFRRFQAPHDQMMNLKSICHERFSVFYAFPLIGTTDELFSQKNIPSVTWFLDVYNLPEHLQPPLRKKKFHYIDVFPDLKKAVIHSPMVKVD